jgi:DNA-directed RNA polymerase specialized sigma24 family protein
MRPLWNERYMPTDDRIVRGKARTLIGHYGYRSSDLDDLRGELAAHVVEQAHRHDPARGTRNQFVTAIITNKVCNMIAHRTAQKRNDRFTMSYDSLGDGVLADSGESFSRVDDILDVAAIRAALPAELREVAELWPEFRPHEIEQKLGLSRAAVRWRIQRVIAFFREAMRDDE